MAFPESSGPTAAFPSLPSRSDAAGLLLGSAGCRRHSHSWAKHRALTVGVSEITRSPCKNRAVLPTNRSVTVVIFAKEFYVAVLLHLP